MKDISCFMSELKNTPSPFAKKVVFFNLKTNGRRMRNIIKTHLPNNRISKIVAQNIEKHSLRVPKMQKFFQFEPAALEIKYVFKLWYVHQVL